MAKFRIIGNMTGNSMDAIDLVLTEFDGEKITDLCSYSQPYSQKMQQSIENLRSKSRNKTPKEIEALEDFSAIHDEYIIQIANSINQMCQQHNIDKKSIDAIGFHGKTLDHNPPSKALIDGTAPYTLQIGSGQMLADLTEIPVAYDFRSDAIMAGFDGAPLVPAHNAHIAAIEGDGIYYNGGNTSNFAIIHNHKALIGSDAGPFNEYTDNFIRQHTDRAFDKDGMFGKQGELDTELLQYIFEQGRPFYTCALPKSGDPAYYHKDQIFQYIQEKKINFNNAVRTFEYFAAYISALTLADISFDIPLPANIILFGGGWKNPIVRQSFENLLNNKGYILPEHQKKLSALQQRFSQPPHLRFSNFGEYMEARLLADLARYRLENKAWNIPEISATDQHIICGITAYPEKNRNHYSDKFSRAAKGWQEK